MFATVFITLISSAITTFAQNSPTVVCIPGQCLQGYSNITIGATLSAPGAPTDIHILPGSYTTDTSPQLLHDLLTSSSASLSPSVGFNGSLSPLPLNLVLQPGLATYSSALYSGQAGFSSLPDIPITNSTPFTGRSLTLSPNVWIATTSGPSSNQRTIIWDSVPDVKDLALGDSTTPLSLVDIQSSACSPPCAGSGVCLASGTCRCAPGFTGSSCESCATGFFGPECKPCPSGCESCDEGITGSGRCLKPVVENAPATCNCLNGVCGSNGQCTCNPGFVTADNGTACAKCASGFFLSSTSDCKVCQLGCTQCADGTGVCTVCKQGFTQNQNDRTKCNPPQSTTSTGTVCPDGSFSSGSSCERCSSTCDTCTGGTSNDCIVCASGRYMSNGACVAANADGICEGSNLIADNNKKECDACDAKCTSCKIPNFNGASTVNQAQCTGCLPGFFLSNGKCVESCPSETFVSSQDNFTCLPCDSSCSSCSGSSTFCLTCASGQLASDGKCVSSCPSNTFSSSGSCITCHPDCASCSGGSFNQCSSCPPNRPVLVNGRCLPTCSKSQFFDSSTSSCQTCDSSCASCSGAGPSKCLSCSGSNQVLRGGSCTTANCKQSSTVLPGLGVCLSELVNVPEPSGTNTPAPMPTITGISTPTVPSKRSLEWWQILLMALGCAFIFLVVVWLFRRRMRKQRAKKTNLFATTPGFNRVHKSGWRWRLVRLGEKLFGHARSPRGGAVYMASNNFNQDQSEAVRLAKLRAAEEARTDQYDHEEDIVKLIGAYRNGPSRSTSPSHDHSSNSPHQYRSRDGMLAPGGARRRSFDEMSSHSAPSMYSQVTGVPRHAPEPRQPLRKKDLTSRFSTSTTSSEWDLHLQASKGKQTPFSK